MTAMTSHPSWAFRRVTRADFALLADWLAQPEVARWWCHEWTAEALERDFGPSVDGDEPNEDWLALLDGEPVGLIQRSRVADYTENLADFSVLGSVPEGALTFDYLVGTRRSTGLGTAMIEAFTTRSWDEFHDAPAILVSVVAANRPSWRTLERAGFRVVGEGDVRSENPLDDSRHLLLRVDRPLETPSPAVVLVEGTSDVAALRALAEVSGIDLHDVRIVSLDGVTNVRRALAQVRQHEPDAVVLGLCDAAESRFVESALRDHNLPVRDATDLPSYGFFVCVADLEDELIRALGAERVLDVVAGLGLSGKFEGLRQQPAWQDRPLEEQLRRFCGVASGRKELLAAAMASALNPDEAPEPMRQLLERLDQHGPTRAPSRSPSAGRKVRPAGLTRG